MTPLSVAFENINLASQLLLTIFRSSMKDMNKEDISDFINIMKDLADVNFKLSNIIKKSFKDKILLSINEDDAYKIINHLNIAKYH